MFLASTSRLYARETTEEEFIRYVRDNGVSAALQPALILLYQLPIKPNNVKEFFAEYLENGAYALTNISLLQAELCYLQAEEQDIEVRLKNLDRDIDNMNEAMLKDVNVKESDASFEKQDNQELPDLLTRFVEDTMQNSNENYNPFDLSTLDFQNEEIASTTEEEEKAEENSTKSSGYITKNDSLLEMIYDLQEFDPWGMIFKYYDCDLKYELPKKMGLDKDSSSGKNILTPDSKLETNNEDNRIEKDNYSDLGESYASSEDADTLVELFRAKILPEAEIDEAVFQKQKAAKTKFSDLMGWNNNGSPIFDDKYPIETTYQLKPSSFMEQSYKNLTLNSNVASDKRNKMIQNMVKFYSEMNSDVGDADFLRMMGKKVAAEDTTLTRGVQTDILQEFEEMDGETWEWDSDDYCLYQEGKENTTNESITNITFDSVFSSEDVEQSTPSYDNISKSETYTNEIATAKDKMKMKMKQSESFLQVQESNETRKIFSSADQTLKHCINQGLYEVQKQRKQIGKHPQDKIDNRKQKGLNSSLKAPNLKLYSGLAKNLKSTQLLKYINETYDADMANKIQEEFDFRIFDD